MTASVLHAPPTRVHREDIAVMEQTAADELPAIQQLWPAFERLDALSANTPPISANTPYDNGQHGDGMAELRAAMPADESRPLVEFYRRHGEIELWLPIRP
ncbi:hypothetical protein [Crossiella cryophila]|uniref:Uncharacterized protein n=1 Tax=Crossiella cryophila TaxID=43355 RepID=A0A7W7FWQ3_9PSEU|nr:hypothetical protein [Crossiella cryophila]MBB4678159.1 hypothetical protein [Crossiella cryophila]